MNLYIVATPIGNLEDITFRAVRILKEVDLILAEDTRNTRILLQKYDIRTPLTSYHQHSGTTRVHEILDKLRSGKNIALVSDAGTPGINDPGSKLIETIVRACLQNDPLKIIPIPGANAAISALSISGFPADQFIFWGFPPHKKGRKTFFRKISESNMTGVMYESTHRILKTLVELPQDREMVIARELTKKFETTYRGKAGEIKLPTDEVRGEFVIIINGK